MIIVLRQDFVLVFPLHTSQSQNCRIWNNPKKLRVIHPASHEITLRASNSHSQTNTDSEQCEAALYVEDNCSSVLSRYSCDASSSPPPLFFLLPSFSLQNQRKQKKNAMQTQQTTRHIAAACDNSPYGLYIQRREGTRLLFSSGHELLYLFPLSLTGCICHSRESRGGDVASLQTNHFISKRRRQHDWPWSTRRVA